ncbi:hypothetical protein ES703_23496 [subsurface metagenome]
MPYKDLEQRRKYNREYNRRWMKEHRRREKEARNAEALQKMEDLLN